MGVEATEETASTVLNHAADVMANDPEAKLSLKDLVRSAVGSALSAIGFAAGSTALHSGLSIENPNLVENASIPALDVDNKHFTTYSQYIKESKENVGIIFGEFKKLTADEKTVIGDLAGADRVVEIIPRSDTDPRPDFYVNDVKTELKTLNGTSLNTLVTRIHQGFGQNAETVILDARKRDLTVEQAKAIITRAIGTYHGTLPGKVEIWTKEGIVRSW